MARILYALMGDARGHMNHSLMVAQGLNRHEFLFVGGGTAVDLRSLGYNVEEVPFAATYYKNNRVDIPTTAGNALKVFGGSKKIVKRVSEIITAFDPDLIISDYEYFTPLAARMLGRDCISFDHQHIVTHCRYDPPPVQRIGRWMLKLIASRFYSKCSRFIIISFFNLPPFDVLSTEVLPPLIRKSVTEHLPTEGDHVLVYQTSPTFFKLFPVLEEMNSRFIIYGFGALPARKNLEFKALSDHGFLEDLASSRYCIVNGGHNVISEALFLKKPVFCFPIGGAYEQFINAYFVQKLSFGDYSVASKPVKGMLDSFESRLIDFRDSIRQENFYGNEVVCSRLEELIGNNARVQSSPIT
jgi:uncharacterized protein (TIGR00661 family)